MNNTDVKWLHVELSSKCNAWCAGCSRNNNGYGLSDLVNEQDLKIDRLAYLLEQLPNVETVQLCGTLGDPIASATVVEAIDLIKRYAKKIQIHTNGSLRNKTWWQNLAQKLQDINHDVWFGIDGLAGVHEIYRQGTDFNKIIDNATAFIEEGGYATWQFIPFAHNEHQIKDCIRLSQKLKFKKFKIADFCRREQTAKNYKTGEEYMLSPSTKHTPSTVKIVTSGKTVTESDCMFLSYPSIYVNADGTISNCCFFGPYIKFDNLEEMFYNNKVLKSKLCNEWCGK